MSDKFPSRFESDSLELSPSSDFLCPKCGKPQSRGVSCIACGVVFDKLAPARPVRQSPPRHEYRAASDAKPALRLLNRVLQLVLLVSLALGLWGYQLKDDFPQPDFYQQGLLGEPLQTPTRRAPFEVEANDVRYRIEPQFDYRLNGVVVSYHNSDSFSDIYHQGSWQDYINIKDLCVIWGDNVASGIYHELDFENTTWTCWVSWPDRQTRDRFAMTQLSNNHLLVHDERVAEALSEVEIGDQVSLRGVLASYSHNGGFQRGTSTVRTDTGNGACETIFVDDFQILGRPNSGWRATYRISLWLGGLSALGLLVLLFVGPVQRMRG